MPDTGKKGGNLPDEDRGKLRQKMALSGILVLAAVVAVVMIFHMVDTSERKEAAAATDVQVTSTGQLVLNESIPADQADESGSADHVYIIEGNEESSNPYMKVDKLAYTNTCLYTDEFLEKLDTNGLKLTRNEIYARHGRMFYEQLLQEYFESRTWYVPRYKPDDFNEDCLNSIEEANLAKLMEYSLR